MVSSFLKCHLGIITEAFCRQFMSKCNSPSILQVDRAPGHIDPVFNKLVGRSGRMILWTPANTSGYVQANDDIINAQISNGLTQAFADWMVAKVMALQNMGSAGAVANPTLEEMCQILAKALKTLTPAAQRRSFEHCLLTLPTDGSMDGEKGSKSIMDLTKKYDECLVPNTANSIELFPGMQSNLPSLSKEGRMSSIWETLTSTSAALPEVPEFHRDPYHHLELMKPKKTNKRKSNR